MSNGGDLTPPYVKRRSWGGSKTRTGKEEYPQVTKGRESREVFVGKPFLPAVRGEGKPFIRKFNRRGETAAVGSMCCFLGPLSVKG